MKPTLIIVVACALAPAAWAQPIGACSSEPLPQEFETYCEILATNRRSSVAHYRVAELLFNQNNWQSSANEYREALNGDLDPKWTEVWSHISLGRIFSITGQRERALNEYKQARRTADDTFGAQDEVTRLLGEMDITLRPIRRMLDPRERAEPVEAAPAEYTEEARIAELEGLVLLGGVVNEDGAARDLTMVRSLGLGLDASAMAAVRQWRFTPGGNDTQAISKTQHNCC